MTDKKIFICKECGQKFKTMKTIVNHLIRNSEILIANENEIKKHEALKKRIIKEMVVHGK
jgi:hypothetical protein